MTESKRNQLSAKTTDSNDKLVKSQNGEMNERSAEIIDINNPPKFAKSNCPQIKQKWTPKFGQSLKLY